MTDIQRPDASDYEPGSGDLEYAMALELYVDHLEAELAEAVRLLETVRLVGRMDDWNKCAGLIDAFLARQEAKHE